MRADHLELRQRTPGTYCIQAENASYLQTITFGRHLLAALAAQAAELMKTSVLNAGGDGE